MPKRLTVHCPAKINLFLAVGRRDVRGYHPLRTVFQAIGLEDILEIEVNPDQPGFFCDDPFVPEQNTVTMAVSLLRELTPIPPMRITLTKQIPSESGLGGGSSDAAGLLRGAKALVPGLPDAELRGIAAAVGADVAFFLVGGRARAEGYGERLIPLPDAETRWLVVARPNVGCPTPAAFRRLDEFEFPWRDFPTEDELYNDFVRVAPAECLALIDRLRDAGALDATLAGSGSAVFGRFADEGAARAAATRLGSDPEARVWFAPTLSRSESLRLTASD